MIHARVTSEPIDVAALLERVESAGVGAAVLFLGRVRDHNDGRPVSGLRYEAYAPMAERVLREIATEARAAFAGAENAPRIAVEHRVGELRVGEVGVAIAAACPHRDEAFRACRAVIEAIKERLPVWKHEHYTDGEAAWLGGASAAPASDA